MREVTPAQRARLGLFILISGGIFLALLVVVSGQKLLRKWDKYYVRYEDVSISGLEIGAQVKYHGVRVGRVDDISIDTKQIEFVIVEIALNHETPVKTDVEAVVSAFSLTGIKIIELSGGSTEAPLLPPGSEIPAGESAFDMISGRAEAVAEKLEVVLTNMAILTGGDNQVRIARLIDNTANVLEDVHMAMEDNRERINSTVRNLEQASIAVNELAHSESIRNAFAALDTTMTEIQSAEIGKAIADLRVALDQAKSTFTHLDLTLLKGRHDILSSLEVMRESLDSFNEFTRLIAEDPSLLLRGRRGEDVIGVTK